MKTCTKCGVEKELGEFHRDGDGHVSQCKVCVRSRLAEYTAANKEKIARYKLWYKENRKEALIKSRKKYYEIHKEAYRETKSEYNKKYRKENREKVLKYHKEYRENNKDKIRAYRQGGCTSRIKGNKLPITDGAEFEVGRLTVVCKLCNHRFQPTNLEVSNRLAALAGKGPGECNFYCSDTCRGSCPLFKFNPAMMIDPNSRIYKEKSEQQEARACQTNHLKQLQCDETGGQSYCQRCGDFIDVDLHHSLEVAKHGKDAINSAGHVLLCAGCHSELHATCV